jgi:hypothetical protein
MEFTDDMLKRIANSIADLRFKFSITREVLIEMGAYTEVTDKAISEATDTPLFQQFRDQVFEQLKGGH